MHILQPHPRDPRSEREEDNDRKGVARKNNTHQRVADDLGFNSDGQSRCFCKKRKGNLGGMRSRRVFEHGRCFDHQNGRQTTYILIAVHSVCESYIARHNKAKPEKSKADSEQGPRHTLETQMIRTRGTSPKFNALQTTDGEERKGGSSRHVHRSSLDQTSRCLPGL